MRLSELEPKFMKRIDSNHFRTQSEKEGADGIKFLCPVCFAKNAGSVGTHGVICWEPSVPQDTSPTPGRWQMQGTGFEDLTLVAGSSSILLNSGCNAHFFIKNGEIIGA